MVDVFLEIEDIQNGLADLAVQVVRFGIRSIAIPPLARVSYHEAAALDFAGIRIKRHYKVGGGFNFIFEFIS